MTDDATAEDAPNAEAADSAETPAPDAATPPDAPENFDKAAGSDTLDEEAASEGGEAAPSMDQATPDDDGDASQTEEADDDDGDDGSDDAPAAADAVGEDLGDEVSSPDEVGTAGLQAETADDGVASHLEMIAPASDAVKDDQDDDQPASDAVGSSSQDASASSDDEDSSLKDAAPAPPEPEPEASHAEAAPPASEPAAAPAPAPAAAPTPRLPRGDLQTIVGFAFFAALTPLIPVPFLDDVVVTRLHRAMSARLFKLHGTTLPKKGAKALSDTPSRFFMGLLGKALITPVRLIFREITQRVLFVKSTSDLFARFVHEGWLLARALETGRVDANSDLDALKALRRAILAACADAQTSPVRALIGRLFALRLDGLKLAAAALQGRLTGGSGDDAAPLDALASAGLEGVIDETFGMLAGQEAYLDQLEARMRAALDA